MPSPYTVLVLLVCYVLYGIGLSSIAVKHGYPNAYLAWVPFARRYLLADVAGDINLFGNNVRNWNIKLVIICASVYLAALFQWVFLTLLLQIVALICVALTAYPIIIKYHPQNALLLSIFFPLGLFLVRNCGEKTAVSSASPPAAKPALNANPALGKRQPSYIMLVCYIIGAIACFAMPMFEFIFLEGSAAEVLDRALYWGSFEYYPQIFALIALAATALGLIAALVKINKPAGIIGIAGGSILIIFYIYYMLQGEFYRTFEVFGSGYYVIAIVLLIGGIAGLRFKADAEPVSASNARQGALSVNGTALLPPTAALPSDKVACRVCGQLCSKNVKFCGSCGNPLLPAADASVSADS